MEYTDEGAPVSELAGPPFRTSTSFQHSIVVETFPSPLLGSLLSRHLCIHDQFVLMWVQPLTIGSWFLRRWFSIQVFAKPMVTECFVIGCTPLSPPCVARTSVIVDAECNIRRGILLEIPVLLCIWPRFARAQGHKHGPVPDPGFLQIREHCSRRGGDGRLDPSDLFAHPP